MPNTTLQSDNIYANIRTYYILLSVLVLLVFGNTLRNGYNMDDDLVTQNHRFTSKGFAGLKDILVNSYYSNSSDIVFGYRPITHLTFAIEHQLLGESPFISHFINLLLYLISVWLLFNLLLRWFSDINIWIPVVAVFLFAVHPVHTEVVASIKNRDEILALLFALLSSIALHNYVISYRWYQLVQTIVFFIIALLSKKSVFPLIVVVPVAMYMLNPARIKAIAMSSVLGAIPAAAIAADFMWQKSVFIFSILCILYATAYVILQLYRHLDYTKHILQLLYKSALYYVLVILLFALGFYLNDWIFYAAGILVYIASGSSRYQVYGFLMLLLNTALAVYYNDKNIVTIVLLQASYLAYLQFVSKTKDWKTIISILIALTAFVVIRHNYNIIFILVQLMLFYFLLNLKSVYGLLFMVLSLVASFYYFSVSIYQWLLLILSLFYVGKTYINRIKEELNIHILILLFIITPLIVCVIKYDSSSNILHNVATAFIPSEQQVDIINPVSINKPDVLKEGRSLHYIENTLVAPHTPIETFCTGLVTLGEYLRLMIFPYELSFYYGYAKTYTAHISDFKFWISLVLHIILLILSVRGLRKNNIISIGILWYIVCILLFSNYIELVAGMVGERLSYTASVGFCIFTAACVLGNTSSLNFKKPKSIEYVVVLVLIIFSIRTIFRNKEWKDSVTLMHNDIGHLEQSAQANRLLALNLLYASGSEKNTVKSASMINQAVINLEKSISIYPYFFNSQYELAKVYIGESNWIKAKQKLTDALALDTSNLFALEAITKVCFELNQPIETEFYANRYIYYVPNNENIHEILAYIMFTSKQYEKARIYAERGLKYFPSGMNLVPLMKDIEQKLPEQKQP